MDFLYDCVYDADLMGLDDLALFYASLIAYLESGGEVKILSEYFN